MATALMDGALPIGQASKPLMWDDQFVSRQVLNVYFVNNAKKRSANFIYSQRLSSPVRAS
jgi:hypothetical protein